MVPLLNPCFDWEVVTWPASSDGVVTLSPIRDEQSLLMQNYTSKLLARAICTLTCIPSVSLHVLFCFCYSWDEVKGAISARNFIQQSHELLDNHLVLPTFSSITSVRTTSMLFKKKMKCHFLEMELSNDPTFSAIAWDCTPFCGGFVLFKNAWFGRFFLSHFSYRSSW